MMFQTSNRVSDPMLRLLSHVPKSGHFLDYLNFGALFDFFLWSICWNLCNLALVKCLLKFSLPNLYKSNIFKWSNYGTKGVDHWVTYPNPSFFLSQDSSISEASGLSHVASSSHVIRFINFERTSFIQYIYSKRVIHAQVFSRTLEHGNSK